MKKEVLITSDRDGPNLEKQNSNLFFRTLKPASVAGFSFLKTYGDTMGDKNKYILFRPAKAKMGKSKWYVYFSYRVPEELRHLYKGDWHRFKVYDQINIIRTKEYALRLCDAVNRYLDEGNNPFYPVKKLEVVKVWDITQALNFFLQKWNERGNEEKTYKKYKQVVNNFQKWLMSNGKAYLAADKLNEKIVELYLNDSLIRLKWSNRYYNDTMLFLRTIFKFLIKEEIIIKNPCADITRKKHYSKKHKYYDEEKFALIRKLMKEHDPLLHFAASIVYFMCVRSEKELKNLRLANISIERKMALLNAEETKTAIDRMIPIPDELLIMFKEMKEKYPANYYAIGVAHHNKFISYNLPSEKQFGNGFLSKRFAKIRKLAGLSSDYTLYGLRHTRAIHLKMDGAKDEEIMRLFGHTDFITTSKYLRDLGVSIDADAINKLNREF